MDELNREEIDKLRNRQHDLGNAVQEHVGQFAQINTALIGLGQKVDAQHLSVKEDLREIRDSQEKAFTEVKSKQDKTNGRVTELERTVAKVVGGLIVLSAGLPFAVFALSKLTGS